MGWETAEGRITFWGKDCDIEGGGGGPTQDGSAHVLDRRTQCRERLAAIVVQTRQPPAWSYVCMEP